MSETIKELLLKIKRIADKGVAGEKKAAGRKLTELLIKYNLTEEDLIDNVKKNVLFRCSKKFERKLLFQCIARVLNTTKISYFDLKKGRFAIELTHSEEKELRGLYDHYRKILEKNILNCFRALVHQYELYNATDDDTPSKTTLSQEDIQQIVNFIRNSSYKPYIPDNHLLKEGTCNQTL